MQRWFFAQEQSNCKKDVSRTSSITTATTSSSKSLQSVREICWKFSVSYKEGNLCARESMAIIGNVRALGEWKIENCFQLKASDENSKQWTGAVLLPTNEHIYYRYAVICRNEKKYMPFIRFVESHQKCRVIHSSSMEEIPDKGGEEPMYESFDVFGIFNEERSIRRGCLIDGYHMIQFKLDGGSIKLEKQKAFEILVKLVPIKLFKTAKKCEVKNSVQTSHASLLAEEEQSQMGQEEDECLSSSDKLEGDEECCKYCKTAVMALRTAASTRSCDADNELQAQPLYGTYCSPEDILIFNITLEDFRNTAYLINIYQYPKKAAADIPPYHIAYQYILPDALAKQEGTFQLEFLCATKHRPLDMIMQFEYIHVLPWKTEHDKNNLKELATEFEKNQNKCWYIGHRGCGKSFWYQAEIIRENSIKSIKRGIEYGADMIEFDVQLTQDQIPILYHDTCINIGKLNQIKEAEEAGLQPYDVLPFPLELSEFSYIRNFIKNHNIPLNKFTLEQLQRVQPMEEQDFFNQNKCTEHLKLNFPFPTLAKVLHKFPMKIPFLIDVKWPEAPCIDKNQYLDLILNVLQKHAGRRQIIFSSHDVNISTMLRFKQCLYPVMLALQSNSLVAESYHDLNTNYACGIQLFGVVSDNSANLLEFPNQIRYVKNMKLLLFCYDEATRDASVRKSLKDAGVNGIIYDRVNHMLNTNDIEENLFMLELLFDYQDTAIV